MMVSHGTHHAAAPAACQPNSVREVRADLTRDAAFPCVPDDFARGWEDCCFEPGGRFLDEALSSSQRTNPAHWLSWCRNLPLALAVIGLALIMVKLVASRGECAGRHNRGIERA